MNDRLPELPLLLADVPPALRQALAQEGVPWAERRSGQAGRLVLFDSRRGQPAVAADQIAIDVNHLRLGRSCDPFEALGDERSECREWRVGGLPARETVARVDRAAVRGQLLSDLRVMVESAGGLWLRVSPYPHPYRAAFNFRIDHDDYDVRDFDATLAAIAGHEHAISHYVCAATHVRHPEALMRLNGAHVGSHGWWHHTYRDAADNLINIRRGIDGLRAIGLDPLGFAAPHGRFNRGLLAALEELSVTHSSEFSLAYDDLPFFPCQSDVLQIPIHPICLGVCLEAARRMPERTMSDEAAAEATLEHWRTVVSEKHDAGDPIFLYGHPDGRLGRFPHLLRRLLGVVDQLPAVWRTTLAAFETWWRVRSAVRISVVRRDGQIEVSALNMPASQRLAIECFRGNQAAAVALDQPKLTFSLDGLAWRRRSPPRLNGSSPATRSPDLRSGLVRYFDWEHVTPIEQINVHTWRGWTKRTLRRMRA